ncbi:putative transcriptional regulatory protein [bioreactor metagenome]|uniref:Putative transcriptional regulatory protein n=1 Tax=bioreactor metagenome TaxID=1076179 RepID=A0A645A0N7_9ZZZZ
MIGREIAVAVKSGGSDSNNNGKLREVIAKAKANNMPNDTIDRSIKKAAGAGDGVVYENITYEGYGPNGVAVIVEVLTDNRNRAAANVRNAFTKGGGNMGTSGCVSFLFDEKGLIVIDKEEIETDEDELMMMAVEAGAEDFGVEEDCYEVTTAPDDFEKVREALEANGIPMMNAEVTMIPQTYTVLNSDEDIKKMNKLLDLLDDDDDVRNVYNNWDEM